MLQGSLKRSLTGFSKRVMLNGTFVLRLWGLIGFSVAYSVHGSCKLLGSGFRVGGRLLCAYSKVPLRALLRVPSRAQ